MSEISTRPPRTGFWLPAFGIIVGFLFLGALVYYVYLPSRDRAVDPVGNLSPEERMQANLLNPAERRARLEVLREDEARALSTYAWIDQSAGVVRLPIERAMELTVRELQQRQPRN